MNPEQMLAQLRLHGEDAGSDFNDGDDVNGWLGWTLDGDVITMRYQPCTDDGTPGEAQEASWRLVTTADPCDECDHARDDHRDGVGDCSASHCSCAEWWARR